MVCTQSLCHETKWECKYHVESMRKLYKSLRVQRKIKAEDEGIKSMLRDEYNRCLELMGQVKLSMGSYLPLST